MSDQTPAQGRFPGDASPGSSGNGATPRPPGWEEPPVVNGADGADLGDADGGRSRGPRRIPEATVARLPVYLRCLVELADLKTVTASSERLAEMGGVNAAKVRKDLSYLGSYGTRGVGYEVDNLILHISRILGLTQDWPVVIVGIGNLGHALAKYRGFAARGFRVVALVDADRSKVGEQLEGLEVRHLSELPQIAADEQVAIGIIATPAAAAQDVADQLVAAGVSSILNFAPAIVTVPPGVSVRKVDLSIELQILSYHQQRRGAVAESALRAAAALVAGDEPPAVEVQGADR
jgi:redox-sensing transcriptional repressor